MKKIQKKTLELFKKYYISEQNNINDVAFIAKHWNDYKEWSKREYENNRI